MSGVSCAAQCSPGTRARTFRTLKDHPRLHGNRSPATLIPTMRLRAPGAFPAALAVAAVVVAGAWSASEAWALPLPVRLEHAGLSGYHPEAVRGSGSGVTTGDTKICLIPVGGMRGAVIELVHRPLGEPRASISFASAGSAIAWMQMPVVWAAAHGMYSRTGSELPFTGGAATQSGSAVPFRETPAQPGTHANSLARFAGRGQVDSIGRVIIDGLGKARQRARLGGRGVVAGWTVVNCDVAAGRCSTMFDPAFVDEIAATHPGARFTAAVHDHRTGCSYRLNPDLTMTTASAIKAQVLAGVLLAAQDQGRSLTESEAADVVLMMHYSHNTPPTSRLYIAIGGAPGMEALDTRFGILGTSHTARYGATVSTAEDRTVLAEQLLIGGGPLNAGSVQEAWDWMSTVSPVQSWGVTAGLPAGYDTALKNGFYPSRGSGWRLGTTGVVRAPDGAYALTVMTDRNPDEWAGIALVEALTRHINAALTAGPPAPRRVDAVTCIEPRPGSSWSSAAAALGDVDPVALRRLNGGEAAPLAGQRICRP